MQIPFDDEPISRVHEGMHVVDAAGDEVGRVQAVQMGDPEALTTDRTPPPRDILDAAMRAVGEDEAEPDVPEPLRSRLRRTGYLKIDGPDLLDTDRYVSSQDVRDVSGERVQLKVRKDELAREA
jgi:hypothetical protein